MACLQQRRSRTYANILAAAKMTNNIPPKTALSTPWQEELSQHSQGVSVTARLLEKFVDALNDQLSQHPGDALKDSLAEGMMQEKTQRKDGKTERPLSKYQRSASRSEVPFLTHLQTE